jgi:drug/metabolite transporter (DMT)-like permease
MMSRQRTGVAAILAGALFFAGQGGELVFHEPEVLWVTLVIGSIVTLAVALWGLRELVGATRMGRVGIRMALGGVAFLCLFAVQAGVEQLRTGDIPDNFLLFLIGFLLILVGQLLFARDLRPLVGRAWLLPIVAVLGLVMALFLNSVGLHDIGLFVFEGAWIGLGVSLLRHPVAALSPGAPARA